MPLIAFDDLYQDADRLSKPVPVAVAGATEPTVLEALRAAYDRRWILPIVAGREREIRQVAESCAINLAGFTILDTDNPGAAAVLQVRDGRAQMLMKGKISTPLLMRAVLDLDIGLRAGRVICQVVLIELRRVERRILLTDTGICIRPTLEQKFDVLRSAITVAHALGENLPRVAVLAATEEVTEVMPETVDAIELQRRGQAGDIPGCLIQGPMSFDLAFAAEAGLSKGVGGPVVGAADVLLFPDLTSANLTVKAIMYTADCRFGGMLCGAACPIVFMSRSDTAATRVNSLALAIRLSVQRTGVKMAPT
jgi:phosphotransacetylase